MLGDRLMVPPGALEAHANVHWNHSESFYERDNWCTKNETGYLFERYCQDYNGTTVCDPYFVNHETDYRPGIPGMFSGNFQSE